MSTATLTATGDIQPENSPESDVGQKVRCSSVTWCLGHDVRDLWNLDDLTHYGAAVPIFESKVTDLSAQIYASKTGDGPEETMLVFDVFEQMMTVTPATVRQLADELRALADKLEELCPSSEHKENDRVIRTPIDWGVGFIVTASAPATGDGSEESKP